MYDARVGYFMGPVFGWYCCATNEVNVMTSSTYDAKGDLCYGSCVCDKMFDLLPMRKLLM
jgi:hypothetical protein